MSRYNDYYVYLHLDCNGTVFYVGKGRRHRASVGYGRSSAWEEIAKDGFSVKMYSENLTEEQAVAIENNLLKFPPPDWKLCNIQPACDVHDLSFEHLSKYFYYDETSPTCLRWKNHNSQPNKKNRRESGDVAGWLSTTSTHKRYKVCLDGREIMVHRIVCILHGLIVPKSMVVNHKDCNPLNNKIENLEVVTQKENSRKSRKHLNGQSPDSNTGYTGVTMTGYREPSGKLRNEVIAHWKDENGKRRSRSFSIIKNGGIEKTIEIARAYREKMHNEINRKLGIENVGT